MPSLPLSRLPLSHRVGLFLALALFASLPAMALDARAKLRSGPLMGYSELTETAVWLQTRVPARAQLRFWPQGRPEAARLSAEVATTAAGDHLAQFVLSELAMGTRYLTEVYLDGERVELDFEPTFATQTMWRWRSDPPSFRIAIGSCAYVNDPPFDRPGTPYGSEYGIFRTIYQQRPDVMLWMGDNVYFREADWLTEQAMRWRWAAHRELPELQALLGSTANYATWDDHDYGPNNSDRTFRGRTDALEVFADYWPSPNRGTLETPGVFTRFEWSDVEVFMLDNRFHRSPNDWPDGPDKQMWGPAQLRWLQEALIASKATFKLVVNGGQTLNPIGKHETAARYTHERDQLLEFLAQNRIPGVILLAGDRHYSDLARLERAGLYPLYEITASPLTAGLSNPPEEVDNPLRVAGSWVNDRHNFGVLDVGGPPDARHLTVRFLDAVGNEVFRQEISAAELRTGTALEAPPAGEPPTMTIEDIPSEEPSAEPEVVDPPNPS